MNIISEITGIGLPVLWASAAIVILIVEIIHPAGFFVSFSVAALIVALKTFFFPQTLSQVGVFNEALFCVIGVALIVPSRKFLTKYIDKTPNINDL